MGTLESTLSFPNATMIPQRELVRLSHTAMLKLTPPDPTLRLLLLRDQFPLQLRLTRLSSNPTPPVSLPPPLAELNSTTVSSLLDTELRVERTTSSLRTHGDHPGVIKVTSRSVLRTSAVSTLSHLSQPSEIVVMLFNKFQNQIIYES